MTYTKQIKKVLVANRGEIAIRVFRACTELGIRTVGIYSKEDEGSYHRYKADEAYIVGKGKKPIDAYLDIEGIIEIAKKNNVDAIHPGYGFLSENIKFAQRCEEEGIIFIGPYSRHLDIFGDKIKAKQQALQANLPIIPGSNGPVNSLDDVKEFGETYGFPIIIKAALGGGGRGMRIVRTIAGLKDAYERAKSEAKAAFGNDEVYVEKYIENPKHIEVQILGDHQGNIIHLFERDCSIQRRHQKLVEVAPCTSISEDLRNRICDAAVQLMKEVEYVNAGTVEFLVAGNDFYFIEVNPRVQVEHTITEMITGIDIVQTQILIAQGNSLHSAKVGIPLQDEIPRIGYAIQARVTTEDPLNNFMPDTGKIMAYRSGGGFGVRLDTGNSFQGAVITPYYDSLLVKVTTHALTFEGAIAKLNRNLKEFRIRGIKTNIPFLENVTTHPDFLSGEYNTSFVDSSPELFVFAKRRDRGTKLLNYIGNVTVNGFPGISVKEKPAYDDIIIPNVNHIKNAESGTKQLLDKLGADEFSKWIKNQPNVLFTDTTFRDAHQSLLATRIRSKDLITVAEQTSKLLPNLFSMEMWGGATFDVAYRFLNEDPWERLLNLREKVPNVLFQMLLRGSNAVGYKNYPDNLVKKFIEASAQAGIDVFRIFDSLNWIKGMEVAIDAVRDSGKLAEASICYTGDILDPTRTKYNLAYYKELAKDLESAGAHILAIKDMAGLLKPHAAYTLISELKDTVDLPIHLHTHDTSGNGLYTYVKAIEAGVDVVDIAIGSMSGLTSQPSANSLYYALKGSNNETNLNINGLEQLSTYWEGVRKYYSSFESGMVSPHTEVYQHEMPGGQYSNLKQQAKGVGLGDRFEEVKDMYGRVNQLFGDVVKVTPSSKVVGDMALFMVQNNLDEDSVYEKGENIDFPDSVIEFFEGKLGQPHGGFPKSLQRIILKGRQPLTERAGESLKPIDFKDVEEYLFKTLNRQVTNFDILSYCLYPKVFMDYQKNVESYGDLSVLDTPSFFHGMKLDEEIKVDIERGKTLIVKLVSIGQAQPDGTRVIYFELNGQPREIVVKDYSIKSTVVQKRKGDTSNPNHINATMPGTVLNVLVKKGDVVEKGQTLAITEAMKMETTVQSPFTGVIRDILITSGESISTGDLLIELDQR
ncbi:pyruvate carboxylase [Gottfriedia acidiceleris]|uniref:Pyruvate carboxylase n=1 Tax=Gottfriedia acidiceleris TaxID=371036 RepID=A0ABY4JH87_9BACI|nr:pyruvate carboxylase [Gottfriedia acidiceleris]UPM53186.1 pyruvate carboxylase [Gottfriedia acidiceleris]